MEQKLLSSQEQELQDGLDLLALQDIRRRGITELTKDNKLPTDTDDRIMLINLSDGLERQIIARKKLKKDEDDAVALAKARAEATLIAIQNRQPVKELTGFHTNPELPDSHILTDVVPGETDITTESLDYEGFMKLMNADNNDKK